MRVLFLSHDFLPAHPYGTEVHTAQLAARLRGLGVETELFTTEKDIARPHLSLSVREWEGLRVHELVNNLFYDDFGETWDWPPAVEAFRGVLDEVRPDVVHVMHLLYLSIGCVEEARRRGIPVVYTLHDFWLQCARFGQLVHADGTICHRVEFARCGTCLARFKFAQTPGERRTARVVAGVKRFTGVDLEGAARGVARWLPAAGATDGPPDAARAARMEELAAARDRAMRERLVPCVDRFLAPSRFLLERLVAWGIPAGRIEHVPNGIERDEHPPIARPERAPGGALRVGFLGALGPHKAPHLLLDAWERLAPEVRGRARLVLYGPKDHHRAYVAELERRAAPLGVPLPGGVPRAEVPRRLAELDLLVVPSVWYENAPLTLLEARAARTAALVSDLGGMAEMVREGETGWRFAPGDPQALARALTELIEAPERLDGLAFDAAPLPTMEAAAVAMRARYEDLVEDAR